MARSDPSRPLQPIRQIDRRATALSRVGTDPGEILVLEPALEGTVVGPSGLESLATLRSAPLEVSLLEEPSKEMRWTLRRR